MDLKFTLNFFYLNSTLSNIRMGATASVNKDLATTNITSKAYNSCPKVTSSNTADLNKVDFEAPAYCGKDSKFTVDQTAGVDANCLISNLQDQIASTVLAQQAEAKAGFGFAGASNIADVKTKLTQIVDNECKDVKSVNQTSINDTKVRACQFHFVQTANTKSACTINSLQKVANGITSKQAADAEGATFANFFGPYGWIIGGVIGLVVVIIVIALIIYAVKSSSNVQSQSTDLYGQPLIATEETALVGGFKFGFNIYSVLIIAIIILLLYYLYNSYYHTDKVITDADIARLNKSVKDAQKIARIDSDCKSTSSASISDTKITDCGLGTKSPSYYDPFGASYADYYDESENGLDDFYKPLFDQMKC